MWLLPAIATASGLLLAALAPGQGSVYTKDAGALSMTTQAEPILRALPESGAPEASGAESAGLEAVGSSGTGTVGSAIGTAAGSTETEAARSVHAEAARAATGSAVNADFVDMSTAAPDSVPEDASAAGLSAFVLLAPGSRRVALDALLQNPGTGRIRFGSPQPRIVMEGSEAFLDADGFVAGWVLR
jgi:hypothetical protein